MIDKELRDYLLLYGCKAALKAGEKIMSIYKKKDFNIRLKSDSSVVTEADTISHDTIKEILNTTRIPLLSEEGRNMLFEERCGWNYYWLVDPLDGTIEFVENVDEFIVSIALMHENKPEIGIICVPPTGKLYFTSKSGGVYRLDSIPEGYMDFESVENFLSLATKVEPIKRDNSHVKLTVTRSHMNDETMSKIKQYKDKFPKVDVITCGSGLKFCKLIDGNADIYMRTTPLFDWDIAAGEVMMQELGYRMEHLNGSDIKYNKEELVINPFYVSTLNK